jgi:8-oxo-dGTP pyrophosphatase MutT (NUDIX family)
MRDEAFGIVPIYRQSRQNSETQFLLVQHQAGHWGFPKGHAEPGESPIAAACREFIEETGIRDYELLSPTAFIEEYSFVKKQPISKTVTYFIALVQHQQVSHQPDEIQDYQWLPFEQAIQRITFPKSKALLQQVNQFLQTDSAIKSGKELSDS